MNVLLVLWKAYGQDFLQKALQASGMMVDKIFYNAERDGIASDSAFFVPLSKKLLTKSYDFVISFNYFSVISNACEQQGIKYVAWTVDSPLYTLYTHSVFNSCNYFFIFDKECLFRLKEMGVKHAWYLPLTSDPECFDEVIKASRAECNYHSQVSFVGSIYTEKSAYDALGKGKDYFAGFMEGLIEAQKKLWGYTLVEKVLKETWSEQLENILVPINGEDFIGKKEMVFANSCILMEATARERREYLEFISRSADVDLYTGSNTSDIPSIHNRGKVDYLTEMPLVFHNSKINLNITLRTIQQGISLRVWDVLACGGFLLTNYQPELEEYFEIGKDLECYVSKEDMASKIEYYLEHETEREEIAKNGYAKIKREHSYEKRIQMILEKINDKCL